MCKTLISLFLICLYTASALFSQEMTSQDTLNIDDTSEQTVKDTVRSSAQLPGLSDTIKKLVIKHYNKPVPEDDAPVVNIDVDGAYRENREKNEKAPIPGPALIELTTPSMVINNDDKYVTSSDIMIQFRLLSAMSMRIGNSEDLSQLEWMPAEPEIGWMLDPGDGYKRVYTELMYPDSSTSSVMYDEIILDETPPEAIFTISPVSGVAGETLFKLNAADTKHNFDVLLRWDYDDDGLFDTDWSALKEEAHQFEEGGGTKKITLEVKESSGLVASTSRDVYVRSYPVPDFNFVQDKEGAGIFEFDASVSLDAEDGNNLSFRWDFDADGSWDTEWSKEKVMKYNYRDATAAVVCLEAKDSDGFLRTVEKALQNRYQDMVYIKSGMFTMGSDVHEIDERPEHKVFLNDYWMDKYPVTNTRYAEFLNQLNPLRIRKLIDIKNSRIQIIDSVYVVTNGFENHPVTHVSWFGAKAYADHVGKNLPAEAEWEKAARGSEERLYPWGNDIDGAFANYWDNGDPFDNGTTPVGLFNGQKHDGFQTADHRSPFGLYDMVDNVREWCADWYNHDYYATSPSVDPRGPRKGAKRVVKGGGYLFRQSSLRISYRSFSGPETVNEYTGFRCVIRK